MENSIIERSIPTKGFGRTVGNCRRINQMMKSNIGSNKCESSFTQIKQRISTLKLYSE